MCRCAEGRIHDPQNNNAWFAFIRCGLAQFDEPSCCVNMCHRAGRTGELHICDVGGSSSEVASRVSCANMCLQWVCTTVVTGSGVCEINSRRGCRLE